MKYKFYSYYKYSFILELEDGTKITNEESHSDDIYKLEITPEGEAVMDNDKWIVDGYTFTAI